MKLGMINLWMIKLRLMKQLSMTDSKSNLIKRTNLNLSKTTYPDEN